MSKNSGFEGPKFGQSLSQNSGVEAIWTAGLSANSGFEGVTEQKFFEASPKARILLLVTKMEAGFICKRVHGLSFDGHLELRSNIKFTGSFLFGNVTCRPLSRIADLRPKYSDFLFPTRGDPRTEIYVYVVPDTVFSADGEKPSSKIGRSVRPERER